MTSKRKAKTASKVATQCGVAKCPTGISGFDTIANGGLPRDAVSLVLGGPGCGKTLFGLEFLVHGAQDYDEPGIFVAFEEKPEKIMANAASFGWDLQGLVKKNKLYFLDAQLSPETVHAGEFDISGLLGMLKSVADKIGAKRIVFDALDMLLDLIETPAAQRKEVWRLNDWLASSGLTAIMSLKVEGKPSELVPGHYGWMQFIPDAVILLRQEMTKYFSERMLRVLKYRGSEHINNDCALVIADNGINVAELRAFDTLPKPSKKRVGTGIERLDHMFGGGYMKGSGILVTGSPGTAKTTTCCAFADAACKRGEKVIYFAFDETGPEIIRNMSSVNMDLDRHVKDGLLVFRNLHSRFLNPEETYVYFLKELRDSEASCMIVDPLSSIGTDSGAISLMAKRLLYSAKARGVTSLWTSLIDDIATINSNEMSSAGVSTSADTWIHLSYKVIEGERNRGLTIVKSRGMGHSNQVRELVLSSKGVTLTDVYTSSGEVLMGTARAQKEASDRAKETLKRAEFNSRQRQLEADIEVLKREMEVKLEEAAILKQAETLRYEVEKEALAYTLAARGADEDDPIKPGRKSGGAKRRTRA